MHHSWGIDNLITCHDKNFDPNRWKTPTPAHWQFFPRDRHETIATVLETSIPIYSRPSYRGRTRNATLMRGGCLKMPLVPSRPPTRWKYANSSTLAFFTTRSPRDRRDGFREVYTYTLGLAIAAVYARRNPGAWWPAQNAVFTVSP